MGLAQYAIVAVQDQWGVLHDDEINGEYATRAFSSEVGTGSRQENASKQKS
jgi:hypothetical protein